VKSLKAADTCILINNEQELDTILKTKDHMFILFYASWCPFSRQFLAVFEKCSKETSRQCYRMMIDEYPDLCEKYDCLVMVDDSHCTGFMGKHGKGTHEHCGVMGRVDIITSTMGKALGGASGGFTASRKEIVELLRQRSRPYLFSNTLPPVIAASAVTIIDLLSKSTERRDKLERNTMHFRKAMTDAGFDIRPGVHPIVPIMLYNAKLAQDFARDMYAEGIYVIGFFYPVVPRGTARIRVQISAAHEKHHIDRAVEAFVKVGRKLGVLK
jgi:glycine C-acetyltransferase